MAEDAPEPFVNPLANRVADPDAPARRVGDLFDRHHDRLFRLALRLTGDRETAADLTQETFLRAARRARSLPSEDAGAEAWLVRVMVNAARDRERRIEVRREKAPWVPAPRVGSDPESRVVARATVRRALAELAPRRRAILVLHELDGETTARIAELLGITRATVRWHLSRGRRELAEWLGPSDTGDRR